MGNWWSGENEEIEEDIKNCIEFDDDGNIMKEDIPLPGGLLLHNFLSPSECKRFIDLTEKIGWKGMKNGDVQVSQHIVSPITKEIQNKFSARVKPFLPAQIEIDGKTWTLPDEDYFSVSYRYNKYENSQEFPTHYDSVCREPERNCESVLSAVIYLNDGFEGGDTIFHPEKKKSPFSKKAQDPFSLTPSTGLLLLFIHRGSENPEHCSTPISGDIPKYIIRTNIMYSS